MTSVIKELCYWKIIPREKGIFNKAKFKELLGYMSKHHEDLKQLW